MESAPPPSGGISAIDSVIAGLKMYFESAIGTLLLYQKERQQYADVMKVLNPEEMQKKRKRDDGGNKFVDLGHIAGKSVADVYGGEHFLRLFGKC